MPIQPRSNPRIRSVFSEARTPEAAARSTSSLGTRTPHLVHVTSAMTRFSNSSWSIPEDVKLAQACELVTRVPSAHYSLLIESDRDIAAMIAAGFRTPRKQQYRRVRLMLGGLAGGCKGEYK